MPQKGTVLGDLIGELGEQSKAVVKEVASAPVDIVKASFEKTIPNPTAERSQQIKAEEQAKLAQVRSGLSMLKESPSPKPEQGASMAERGQTNQNARMNNSGQQLSANMTQKKKPEPLVVQQKRNNKLHGAG